MGATVVVLSAILVEGLAGAAEPRWGAFRGNGPVRPHGPVIVQGASLAALDGEEIRRIRLLAYRDGRLVSIPFQVDERDPEGDWVFSQGIAAGVDVDGGRLDANDELVFMATDVGERTSTRPPEAERFVELAVHDPVTGGRGWVYAGTVPRGYPVSPLRYVRLDAETDSIDAAVYSLTFSRAIPVTWAYVAHVAGGRSGNVLDRFKIRARAHLLFDAIEWQTTEEDIRSVPSGYIGGPVRIVRRVTSAVELGLGIETPEFDLDFHYYADSADMWAPFYIPFPPGLIIPDIAVDGYLDFRASGWRGFTSRSAAPTVVDGVTTDDERALDRGDTEWIAGFDPTSPEAPAVLARCDRGPGLEQLSRDLYYTDDAGRSSGPEAEAGERGVGWTFRFFEGIDAGTYEMQVRFAYLREFAPGDEARVIDLWDRPVEVEVTRPPAAGAPSGPGSRPATPPAPGSRPSIPRSASRRTGGSGSASRHRSDLPHQDRDRVRPDRSPHLDRRPAPQTVVRHRDREAFHVRVRGVDDEDPVEVEAPTVPERVDFQVRPLPDRGPGHRAVEPGDDPAPDEESPARSVRTADTRRSSLPRPGIRA